MSLAQDLGLNLVAEGIEDEEAVAQLTEMGCPLGQGYLFGKPLVAADAEAMLTRQIELAKQMQAEAAARKRQAEAEAAAQKVEKEKRDREERRRKEAEELEQKQAYARSIAEQSMPKPVSTQPPKQGQVAQDTKPDALEVQLAANLAANLAGEAPVAQSSSAQANMVQANSAHLAVPVQAIPVQPGPARPDPAQVTKQKAKGPHAQNKRILDRVRQRFRPDLIQPNDKDPFCQSQLKALHLRSKLMIIRTAWIRWSAPNSRARLAQAIQNQR